MVPVIAALMREGLGHHQARRLREAVDRYARVVELLPEHGEAWRLLGVIALETGDVNAARGLLERALRINPADSAAYLALGRLAESVGDLAAAQAAFAAACAIDPAFVEAVTGMARTANGLGRPAQAIAVGEAAVMRGSVDAALLRELGKARLRVRDYVGAADAFLASLRMEPHADTYANLGAACIHLHRIEAGIRACTAARTLDPGHADAANNLGIAQKAAGDFTAALTAFEEAVAAGSEAAHVNLGTTRLLLGEYHRGWPEFGWVNAERRANPLFGALPMWDGTAAPGRRLLIWPEQGVGDTIQMARFIGRARRLVGSVTLACPLGTADLLRYVDGVDACIDAGMPPQPTLFDLWVPTIRLPVIFDVARDAVPEKPYLVADARRSERFRAHLESASRARVGLVWSGNPDFAWNGLRSCGLAALAPLGDVPGITWFALQQGVARAEAARSAFPIVPINERVADFADTAAIVSELDLVITVDTSVAHLAGALGRPAWVLLSSRPDWRWQSGGERTPWYPSLRLFRQGDDGEWGPVVAAVVAELRART